MSLGIIGNVGIVKAFGEIFASAGATSALCFGVVTVLVTSGTNKLSDYFAKREEKEEPGPWKTAFSVAKWVSYAAGVAAGVVGCAVVAAGSASLVLGAALLIEAEISLLAVGTGVLAVCGVAGAILLGCHVAKKLYKQGRDLFCKKYAWDKFFTEPTTKSSPNTNPLKNVKLKDLSEIQLQLKYGHEIFLNCSNTAAA